MKAPRAQLGIAVAIVLGFGSAVMMNACFSPDKPTCQFRCGDPDMTCPPDYVCVADDGYCHRVGQEQTMCAFPPVIDGGAPDTAILADAAPDTALPIDAAIDAPVTVVDADVPDAAPDAALPDASIVDADIDADIDAEPPDADTVD